ncbi:hypothetical protein IRJ41_020424, partial [Triplophysa rosa]
CSVFGLVTCQIKPTALQGFFSSVTTLMENREHHCTYNLYIPLVIMQIVALSGNDVCDPADGASQPLYTHCSSSEHVLNVRDDVIPRDVAAVKLQWGATLSGEKIIQTLNAGRVQNIHTHISYDLNPRLNNLCMYRKHHLKTQQKSETAASAPAGNTYSEIISTRITNIKLTTAPEITGEHHSVL